ncbi:MAG TPA: hypothetical protein PKY96_06550, partial [Flavobacteriales bacterium]|nr:hypothetical protein [Flavobacteriales bacterium]
MRPRLVLLPLIQILSGAVQAQALPGIDSLRNVAFNAGLPDSVRLSALNAGLEPWFQAGLPDSAIAWAAEGLRIARSGTNADRTVGWMKLLGTMHGRSGDLTRSRELLFQALEHRPMPKDPTMLPRVRLNVAVSYQIEGAFSAALEHAHKALKELEPVGDSAGVAHACILIGSLHIDSDHALSAAPYLKRALAIQEAAGDPRARNALVGLARVALVRGDTTAALQLYDRALSISKDIGDLESCALISLNRAEVHIKRTELSRAAEILDSAAAFHRDPMVDIRMQLLRCEILVLQDRYHDALDGLQRLIAQAEPLHLLVQLETAHLLRSQVLEAIGDHHGALVEYKRSQQLGDSILSQEQVRKLSDIELS